MKRQDLTQALLTVLVRHFVQRRDAVLAHHDRTGRCWDRELTTRLEQVDEALTRLGHFDS